MKSANQDPGGNPLIKALLLAYLITGIMAFIIIMLKFKF